MEKSYKLPHNVYLILFGLGVIIHYVFLGIWLTLHDFQVAFFLKLIFHSLISLLLVADLILSAIVVLMFSFYNLSFTKFLVVVIVTLLAGVSASLPLMLYFIHKPQDTANSVPN